MKNILTYLKICSRCRLPLLFAAIPRSIRSIWEQESRIIRCNSSQLVKTGQAPYSLQFLVIHPLWSAPPLLAPYSLQFLVVVLKIKKLN